MDPSWSDPHFLSRIQFAVTIMFHILFPTLTIGLGFYLVILEALWLAAGGDLYYRMYRFWVRIFAINFGVGVVSGIIMEFEFGTNWSCFSFLTANVFSPLLYYEVMTAFFLESGFLGIMLFRLEAGESGNPFPRHLPGGYRCHSFRLLDHGGQLMDADAGRLRNVGREIHGDQLCFRHL